MIKKILIIIFLFILDYASKLFFLSNPDFVIKIIPNFLSLHFVKNSGISFGVLANKTLLIIFINIVIICALVYFMKFVKSKIDKVGIALILVGSLSNFIDRLFLGYVIDFIDVGFFICNIADIYIFLGACLLIFGMENNGNKSK